MEENAGKGGVFCCLDSTKLHFLPHNVGKGREGKGREGVVVISLIPTKKNLNIFTSLLSHCDNIYPSNCSPTAKAKSLG